MNRTVFFSWQSDLPNSTNRTFIESCIIKAISEMKHDLNYKLELNLDRDTSAKQGTPDIAESIFEKINHTSFFIADVSLINGSSRKYKKAPNPNVLLELGYAVNRLGWERVICLFNSDFGQLKDLPFDLRNRRIVSYQTENNKANEKNRLASIIKLAFEENYSKTIFSNELMDYYNSDIYAGLFRVLSDLCKIVFGYDNQTESLNNIQNLLGLTPVEILNILKNGKFLGFLLFKTYDGHVSDFANQLEKIVPIKYYADDYYVPLIRIVHTLRLYNKDINRKAGLEKYNLIASRSSEFSIVGDNLQHKHENRLLLLKKLTEDTGIVLDFGDFLRKDHINNLLNSFILNDESVNFYSAFINKIIKEANQWIDNNNGEFILDESKFDFHD